MKFERERVCMEHLAYCIRRGDTPQDVIRSVNRTAGKSADWLDALEALFGARAAWQCNARRGVHGKSTGPASH